MSSLMRPVGPRDPATYWKRRALVLLVLLLFLLLAVTALRALFTGGSSGASAPAPTSSSPSTSAPSSSSTTSASGAANAPACAASAVSVTARTDRTSYAAGSKAQLDMRIMNTGKSSCSLDVGSKAVELVVSAGNRKVWSSSDCQSNTSSQVSDVRPGASLHATISWNLTATPATCGSPGPGKPVPAGTYTLVTRDGQFKSGATTFKVTAGQSK